MVFNSINKLYDTVKTESYNNVLEKAIEQTNNILDNHINSLLKDNNYVFASEPYMDFDCIKRKTLVADTYEGMLKLIEKHKLKGTIYQKQSLKMLKKENENMSNTKTFQEVIRDIKKGEVWENQNLSVSKIYIDETGNLVLRSLTDYPMRRNVCVGLDQVYTLQRKKISFAEAFAAYEEGKEIESRDYRYKKINNEDGFYLRSGDWDKCTLDFSIDEIRGVWHINE